MSNIPVSFHANMMNPRLGDMVPLRVTRFVVYTLYLVYLIDVTVAASSTQPTTVTTSSAETTANTNEPPTTITTVTTTGMSASTQNNSESTVTNVSGASTTTTSPTSTTAAVTARLSTASVATTTTETIVQCKNGTCSGNVSCIQSDVTNGCVITDGIFCYMEVTTVSDNSLSPVYTVGCREACEHLVQEGNNSTVVTKTETFCCSTHLCNNVQLTYTAPNTAGITTATSLKTLLTASWIVKFLYSI